MVVNIGQVPVQPDVMVTIAGTVVAVREDEFLLQDSTGQIWVEPANGARVTVNIGDQLTIMGDRDDVEDFDAISITRTNSPEPIQIFALPGVTPPVPEPTPPVVSTPLNTNPVQNIGQVPVQPDVMVTIAGTVAAVREDEFLLQDSTGQIWVEPQAGSWNGLNVNIGDRLTIVGDRDDVEDFDAISIIRGNSPGVIPLNWQNPGGQNPLQGTLMDDVIAGNPIIPNSINGQSGNDTLFGGEVDDVLSGNAGQDMLLGLSGNDIIFGGKGDDTLWGNQGQDMLLGNLGNDLLFGGKDSDFLDGGEGNDTLSGDLGQDFLTGGPGNDMFVLSSETAATDLATADRVLDFEIGFDRIQLSPGLTFADLSLEAIDLGTAIRVPQFNQVLGIIDNVTPSMLSANDFLV